MKIASSMLQLESRHRRLEHHEIAESLRAWSGAKRAESDDSSDSRNSTPSARNTVQISDAGRAKQSRETSAIESAMDAADNDPVLRMIRAMIAILTGEEVDVFDASDLATDRTATAQGTPAPAESPVPPSDQGFEYVRTESYTEIEQTAFSANGIVRTSDGKEIEFSLSLSMQRSFHMESSESLSFGNARARKDPLVVNFDGPAAQLTSQRFKFDIDSDGTADDINFVGGGSGFLALDRNGDGKINDGSELFGATSGNGFADLAAYDDDRNGWIDENDAAFSALRVWTKDATGKDRLLTLKESDVGAISLANVASPFDLKTGQNDLLGQIRSSGIFLKESGGAGTIQQIDLTV